MKEQPSAKIFSRRNILFGSFIGALALKVSGEINAQSPTILTPYGEYNPPIPLPSPTPETAKNQTPRFIIRGNTERPEIAFTFDGGAGSRSTPYILDILSEKGVRSNMFLSGLWMEQNPQLVAKMIADGHHIANHSWNHLNDFTNLSDYEIRQQLIKTEVKAQEFGVSTKPYFRPPFGGYNNRVVRICAEEGYSQFVYWTYDSGDWKIPELSPQTVYSNIVNNTSNGAIFVMHLDSRQEPLILAGAIDAIREKGFTLTTVPDLLREE